VNGTSKTQKSAASFSSSCTCGLDALGPVEAERWTPGNSGHLHSCPARLSAPADYLGTEHACQLIPTRAVSAGEWGPTSYYGTER
jgi:hypothetical protein